MPKLTFYEMGSCKKCQKCLAEKPLADFYKNQHWCKACNSEYSKAAYAKKKELILARNKKWSAGNKERHKALTRKWAVANKSILNAGTRAWREANKDYDAFRAQYRRAMKKMAIPGWANKFFMLEAHHLASLRSKLTGIKWHVDHIVPIQSTLVCGLHCEQNLQLLPDMENYAKGNRVWPEMP